MGEITETMVLGRKCGCVTELVCSVPVTQQSVNYFVILNRPTCYIRQTCMRSTRLKLEEDS